MRTACETTNCEELWAIFSRMDSGDTSIRYSIGILPQVAGEYGQGIGYCIQVSTSIRILPPASQNWQYSPASIGYYLDTPKQRKSGILPLTRIGMWIVAFFKHFSLNLSDHNTFKR